MKAFLKALAVSLMLAGPATADTKDEVTAVIQSQIEAFLAEDVATAFTFASPGIKRMFGSPDRFGLMVRQGYPMVWRPADVQYLELREESGAPVQRVLITDEAGATHLLEYYMVATGDGWQIGGVRILEAAGLGA
ncbi:MAG: DUF4864 domain-containing protein [Paracoccaceae bacterium]|nr:DUF4864 domain-containing protein [Paracoccaceae bacterium]